jgi:hypothetical protein
MGLFGLVFGATRLASVFIGLIQDGIAHASARVTHASVRARCSPTVTRRLLPGSAAEVRWQVTYNLAAAANSVRRARHHRGVTTPCSAGVGEIRVRAAHVRHDAVGNWHRRLLCFASSRQIQAQQKWRTFESPLVSTRIIAILSSNAHTPLRYRNAFINRVSRDRASRTFVTRKLRVMNSRLLACSPLSGDLKQCNVERRRARSFVQENGNG